MYLSSFLTKHRPAYRQLCLELRRRLCRQLNPALNLNLDLSPGNSLRAAFGLAKYHSSFIRKHPQMRRELYGELRRQVCHKLCPELNLSLNFGLNLNLNLNLNSRSYPSLFRQMLAALFGSMLESKYAQLLALSHLALRRQKLPPRRPLGRGVDGRIVVRDGLTTTYRRRPVSLLCPLASRGGRALARPRPVCCILPTAYFSSRASARPPPSSSTGIPACRGGRTGPRFACTILSKVSLFILCYREDKKLGNMGSVPVSLP